MAAQNPEVLQQVLESLRQRQTNTKPRRISSGDSVVLTNLLRTANAGKDPLKGSKNALDAKIAAILASNAPDSVKQSALKLSSNAPKQEAWWEKVTNTLGKGKSAVVATVGSVADPKRDWSKDYNANVGVGDLLANQDWYKDLGTAAKFVVGLGGDIALDPLTYIAGAGLVSKVGDGAGAAKLAFDAADAAAAAGKIDDAAKFSSIGQKASKGFSTLGSGERSVVRDLAVTAGKVTPGEKTGGLFLNVPGTGRIARKVTGIPLKQVQILPESIASIVPSKLRGVEEFARASSLGQKAKKYVGGEERLSNLIGQLRRGSPEEARGAYHTIGGINLGSARKSAYLRDVESARINLVNTAERASVNMDDITRGLGGDLNAAKRVDAAVEAATGEAGFMARVRAFDDAVVDEAHRLVGKNFINKVENHAPTKAGPGVTEGVPIQGRNNPFDPAGFELGRSNAGDTFMGEALLDPQKTSYGEVVGLGDEGQILTRSIPEAEVAAAKAEGRIVLTYGPDELGRDVKSQREAIVKAKFGEDSQAMYNMNWAEASAAQVRGMANRIEGEVIKNHLRAKGVAKDTYQEVSTNAAKQAQDLLPGLRNEIDVLDANNGLLRVLRDLSKKDLNTAQQNLEWVAKESADNVAAARQASELMSESYGAVDETVQALFDEAAAAGVRLNNATLDRKMAEEILTALGPDSPLLDFATAELRKIADDLAKETAKQTEQYVSLEQAVQKYSDLYKSLDDTVKANWETAYRIDELAQDLMEKTRRLGQLEGAAAELPERAGTVSGAMDKIEDVVYRNIDPLTPSTKTLNDSSIVNNSALSAPREATKGRLVMTREGNVIADYDSLKEVVGEWVARETARVEGTLAKGAGRTAEMPSAAGSAVEVKEVARALNKSLREAGLPTIPIGSSPPKMLEKADEILRAAKLEKQADAAPSLSRATRNKVKKLKREIEIVRKELDDLEALNPRESIARLMHERSLMADSVNDFGVSLDRVTTRLDAARSAESANQAKIDKLRQDRINASQANRSKQINEKIDTEIAMREEATRLRNEALAADDRVRVTREQIQAADDVALETELVAAMEIDKAQSAVARLEAAHLQNEADLARSTRKADRLNDKIGRLSSKENETTFIRAIQDGFARLDMTTQAPDHIVDALMQVAKMTDPKEIGLALKTFDALTSMFKSWAILTPGFHVRNFLGGMFNNYLAGVDIASYRSFLRADKIFTKTLEATGDREAAFRAINKAFGKSHMEAYRVVDSSSILKTSGQIGSASGEIGVGAVGMANGSGFQKFRETLKAKGSSKGMGNIVVDNPLTRVNYMASERVERTLRGALAYDTALKGGDEIAAIGNVYKFHFNYDDLSSIEQRWMKRISPFYTWSRRNVPLQVEMLFKKPGVYANIGIIQDNIEKLSPGEDLVPAWFSQVGGFRLPFSNPQGERLYMMPDLPPLDLRKIVNPQEWLGEINPVLKVPLELQFDRQLYNQQEFRKGYVPFPEAWNKLGIGAITDAIGMTEQDVNGQRVGRDSDMYALESYMPLLGRLRRLFPSEEKYQRRAVGTWASMIFGLGFRANTEADKKGELYNRSKNVENINTDLQGRSYGGYETLSRDVATRYAPVKGAKSPYVMITEPKGGLPFDSPYTMPTKGRSGDQALSLALRRLRSKGGSKDLVDLVMRVQGNSKK